MSDRASTKHRKEVRRRRLLRERRLKEEGRRDRPRFSFEPGDAEPGFVRLIREAASGVDLADPAQFDPWHRDVFRALARDGWPHARLLIALTGEASGLGFPAVLLHLLKTLGRVVFDRAGEEQLLSYIPVNDVQFLPRERGLVASFRALRRAKGPGGTAYFSGRRPAIRVDGRSLVVAFSIHAVGRACDRVVPTWKGYGGLGDAFALFEQCLQFEPCEVGGRPGFTFWENCAPGFFSGELPRLVLGAGPVEGRPYRFRVGYCPAVVEGAFFKAKTLLFPGYDGTPEHRAVLRSKLPWAEREALLRAARDLDMTRLSAGEGLEALRRFQGLGVPQVAEGRALYAPGWEGRSPWEGNSVCLTGSELGRLRGLACEHAGAVRRAAVAAGDIRRVEGCHQSAR
jgi:hypothetical protein